MYRRLLVLALGTFAMGTDSFVIAGVLPEVSHSLHVGTAAAAQLITAYALPYAVLAPVLATLTARWPRRAVLLAGLGVFVLGNVATALLPLYGAVLVARMVTGVGAAMYSPTATGAAVSLAPPERRARALAVVVAGLTSATALGSPLGTALGSAVSWRVTMAAVAGLGALALLGVLALLPAVPSAPRVPLRARIAPVRDRRVALTLVTTLLAFTGPFAVYGYLSLAFHRATGGDGTTLAVLMFGWGVAATVGNLGSGALIDRLGSRRVLNVALLVAVADFLALPFTSARLVTAVPALVVWGLAVWSLVVAQQHRLVTAEPTAAPLLVALNQTAVYLAISVSGVVGAAAIALFGGYRMGVVGAVLLAAALVVSELAYRTSGSAVRDGAGEEAQVAGPVGVR